jgi:hypothetical protein
MCIISGNDLDAGIGGRDPYGESVGRLPKTKAAGWGGNLQERSRKAEGNSELIRKAKP